MIITTPVHVDDGFVIIRVELLKVLTSESIVSYVLSKDKCMLADLRWRIIDTIETINDGDFTIDNARLVDTLLSQTKTHEVYTILGKLDNVNAIRPAHLTYKVSHTSGEKPDWMKYVTDQFV